MVNNHALVDGNKRLGWLATAVFLERNGASVATATNDEVFVLVMGGSDTSRATALNVTIAAPAMTRAAPIPMPSERV